MSNNNHHYSGGGGVVEHNNINNNSNNGKSHAVVKTWSHVNKSHATIRARRTRGRLWKINFGINFNWLKNVYCVIKKKHMYEYIESVAIATTAYKNMLIANEWKIWVVRGTNMFSRPNCQPVALFHYDMELKVWSEMQSHDSISEFYPQTSWHCHCFCCFHFASHFFWSPKASVCRLQMFSKFKIYMWDEWNMYFGVCFVRWLLKRKQVLLVIRILSCSIYKKKPLHLLML